MKTLFIAILVIALPTTFAFAGGSGGGGVMLDKVSFRPNVDSKSYIFAKVTSSNIVKVYIADEYGLRETSNKDLAPEAEHLIEQSLRTNSWVPLDPSYLSIEI